MEAFLLSPVLLSIWAGTLIHAQNLQDTNRLKVKDFMSKTMPLKWTVRGTTPNEEKKKTCKLDHVLSVSEDKVTFIRSNYQRQQWFNQTLTGYFSSSHPDAMNVYKEDAAYQVQAIKYIDHLVETMKYFDEIQMCAIFETVASLGPGPTIVAKKTTCEARVMTDLGKRPNPLEKYPDCYEQFKEICGDGWYPVYEDSCAVPTQEMDSY